MGREPTRRRRLWRDWRNSEEYQTGNDSALSHEPTGDREMDAWLDRLEKEIEETTVELRDSDWSRAPEQRWNSAQIMEHLGRTYGTTAKMLELSMGTGSPQLRAATFSERLKKLLVVNLGVLPSGADAPPMVTPKGDPGPVALERALANLKRLDAAIAAAEERWGGMKPVAMHPILGPLNPREWRKFHYIHGHHHLLQIRKRLEYKAEGVNR